ncbi:ABC transporter ATP-binding protein [Pigmentiphaga sp. GD03639]|uniref:ABC transporter ATP-binding protein n=1 Tax=Pigmentiphaga sp. GD03639 TaxID=2975354 RepID=UPI00244C5665|nr:ABC transporter ATP-binding protein [Pigmentiphaga sp. GD03639]MDH2238210.1 ABC transporter ATP-binding protein [Pigmentiphaga sp. GD03639]
MSIFSIRKLSQVYGGAKPVHALADIDLDIDEGEFVVLLGPSGCGKSTLLEILAGLQRPTAGKALFDGRPIAGPFPSVGVVFQDASLLPWRTVARNVQLGLEIRGRDKALRRQTAKAYLELVGLAGFGDKYPHQLSGGMRQRAGIARALANEPSVLLMDEPFGAVDHITRIRLQEDLVRIWQAHRRTVVFVTHDVGEAVFLADRIVLLSPRPGHIHDTFRVAVPRPRRRGDLPLLKLEASIYDALHAIDTGASPARAPLRALASAR